MVGVLDRWRSELSPLGDMSGAMLGLAKITWGRKERDPFSDIKIWKVIRGMHSMDHRQTASQSYSLGKIKALQGAEMTS